MREMLKREVRVALSPRAQPVPFRVVKWLVAIIVSVLLWSTPYFWWWIGGALAISLTLHLIWRWGTRGWTRPWAGWDDVKGADGD